MFRQEWRHGAARERRDGERHEVGNPGVIAMACVIVSVAAAAMVATPDPIVHVALVQTRQPRTCRSHQLNAIVANAAAGHERHSGGCYDARGTTAAALLLIDDDHGNFFVISSVML
jgi:hypothetical protein